MTRQALHVEAHLLELLAVLARVGNQVGPLVQLGTLREPIGPIDRAGLVGDEHLRLDPVPGGGVGAEQLVLDLLRDAGLRSCCAWPLQTSAPSWW